MKLAYWMYSGPAHIGTLRVTSSFTDVQAIMHAPLGDDYFNVMRSMLERQRFFTPALTSTVDRHVLARGSQQKVINNICRKDLEDQPKLLILTPTCTSSILQEDLENFVNRARLEIKADVLLADVNHYRVNEIQAADKTLEQIVDFYLSKEKKKLNFKIKKTLDPSVNIIGSSNLAFHNQHDLAELKHLLIDLGLQINEIIPQGTSVQDLQNLPAAWFNIVPYREIGLLTAQFLEREFNMPYIDLAPIGINGTAKFIRKIQEILNSQNKKVNFEEYISLQTRFVSQSGWFSRSIDCKNLIGKKAFVFGDATHAAAITKILAKEMGVQVVMAGTYCKHDKAWFIKEVSSFCKEIIITEDHKIIGDLISNLKPNAIFGTQMERHIAKRLNIPCGVISAPIHIQNFPLSYRPFCGYEGANQIADLIYNSFTLGMEDHLLEIFGGHDIDKSFEKSSPSQPDLVVWSNEAKEQLLQIPGFIRGEIKRKTENFALRQSIKEITLGVLYEAKEVAK